MKLEKWALVGEIIGSVAVVASLVVLIFEVRGNTAVLETSAFQSVSESWTDFTALIASDPDLTRIYFSGRDDPSALNSDEIGRFNMLMITIGRRIESAYILQQSGLVSQEEGEGFRYTCRSILDTRGGREWFERQSTIFTESFRDFVRRGCDAQ